MLPLSRVQCCHDRQEEASRRLIGQYGVFREKKKNENWKASLYLYINLASLVFGGFSCFMAFGSF